MKVNVYKLDGNNTGNLEKSNEVIEINPRRWLRKETSHPMNYSEPKAFENKNVYFLYLFGDDSKPTKGVHISLSFWENLKFLFMQKSHWSQEPLNWLPVIIATASLVVSIITYFK